MGEHQLFLDLMISCLRSTSKYYTGYPKDLGISWVFNFTSERQFVQLLHEGRPVVVAFPVLADVIESISGTIYIDSKSNKEIVWNSIRRLLEPVVTPETRELNPLRELNDLCCRRSYNMSYSKTCQGGVASIVAVVEANGVVYMGESTGTNKKTAKKLAAKDVPRTIKNAISGLQH